MYDICHKVVGTYRGVTHPKSIMIDFDSCAAPGQQYGKLKKVIGQQVYARNAMKRCIITNL